MNIVVAKGIVKTYKAEKVETNVLKGIDISVESGQFVSIMGPSGCGKSTLLYILGGLDNPTEGEVNIDGKDISKLKDKELSKLRRNDIGFIFQFYNLVQNLTVRENIFLPIKMANKSVKDYEDKYKEILKIVRLKGKDNKYPAELSGGEQQRVSIARAVLGNPKLILADEPTGNLDSKTGDEIMDLFRVINKEKGITVIQVTHDEGKTKYGNRIIRLKDGVVVEDKLLHDGVSEE